MTTKEYLKSLKGLKEDIRRVEKEITRLEVLLTRLPKNVKSLEKKKVREELKYQMFELECSNVRYATRLNKILEKIDTLPKESMKRILKMRYLDGKEYFQIADELGYSETYIKNLHTEALKAFEELL